MDHKGHTEPRIFTPPLRPLTPQTTLGYEFISFCESILQIELYPWQKWLAIHGLELLEDGSYRFRKILVLVARQNGKTMFASALAAWWLFIDSRRYPDRVPPFKFKVLGIAQNLDVAREPFTAVCQWANPEPDDEEEAELVIPQLAAETRRISRTNGKEAIVTRALPHYEIRAPKSSRGKPAARVIMDELREMESFAPWNAVSQTPKSFFNGQMWAISNAGTHRSVVLRKQWEVGTELVESLDEVLAWGGTIDEWAATSDTTIGHFEWSAPPGSDPLSVEAILAANPSIGYGGLTIETCRSDYSGMLEADYRTEVLCQWVETAVDSYIKPAELEAVEVGVEEVKIPKGSRTVWAVDTSVDRSTSYVAAAVYTEDGRPFLTVRESRPGTLWVVPYLTDLAERSGFTEVVIQAKGAPAMEFIAPLKEAGLTVHEIIGSWFGVATGRIRDRIRQRGVVVVAQPAVQLAVAGGITRSFGETDAWNRSGSEVDISPIVAMTLALYGLETLEPEPEPESAYESGGLMII